MTEAKEQQWPAVLVAYDFVLPSYQWMSSRLEAVAGRIQTLMAFATTVTLGVPVLGQAIHREISFDSISFLLAVALFLALMGLGLFARDLGKTWLTSPAEIYRRSLHLSEWEFKRDAIYLAGEAFRHNAALADKKALFGSVMALLMVGEVISFLCWIGGPEMPASRFWSWVRQQIP